MDSGKKEYSFLWLIENYSYCGQNLDEKLISPQFTPQGLGGSSWFLYFYPAYLNRGRGSILLNRYARDTGPEKVSLKLEISIITMDESILYTQECEATFRKGAEREFKTFEDIDELFWKSYTQYLHQDTLGVRCTMRKDEGIFYNVNQCTARTRITIENISFPYTSPKFSYLQRYVDYILKISHHSKPECFFSIGLAVCDTSFSDDALIVNIKCSDRNYILCKMKISLINVSGNAVKIGEIDYRFFSSDEQIRNLHKSFTKQFILNRREQYLKNAELSLVCECTFATGVEHKIEETLDEKPEVGNTQNKNNDKTTEKLPACPSASEETKKNDKFQCLINMELEASTSSYKVTPSTRPFVSLNQMTNNDINRNIYINVEILSTCPSVLDDLKALYKDQLLTDVEIKTATDSFPTHKNILCARSSVFRAMLTNDMKEKNTNCIKVEDLENETVHQLLLFLYSDNLEDLQWESALQLYYAGDKYAIERLKVLCSSFLVDNLSTFNASELLLLADTHSNIDLKKIVEDFILEHEEDVFCSVQWEKLNETNPQLVMKTMQLKYKREKGTENRKQTTKINSNNIIYDAAEKLSKCPSAFDDLETLYNDQILTDVVIKTATKSFPTHKSILSARSSVFRAMLANNKEEKIIDCIKVEDLENETVHQLLLFLYSENLKEIQLESALKLYNAGDKYVIDKLTVLCSCFLIRNLSTITASELLLLADKHSVTDFKKIVEDFILEHDEVVFCSDEWEKLNEMNPRLAIKTMQLKHKRK